MAGSSSSFVAGLARWIAPPATTEVQHEEESASRFEAECAALESDRDFLQLYLKLASALRERFLTASVSDIETSYGILFRLLLQVCVIALRPHEFCVVSCVCAPVGAVRGEG